MGAFEYTALDAAGREQKGVLEGDTAAPRARAAARAQLLPVTRRRGRRARGAPPARSFVSPRRLDGRRRAADAPARHALRPACRSRRRCSRSRSRRSGRACRASARRARQGDGGPHAGRRPRRFPARVPGDLPGHGGRRRAVRPSRRGARAARRLHREPRQLRQKRARRDALPDRAVGDVPRHRLGLLVYVVPKVVEVFENGQGHSCRSPPAC
jgi:hypothetical protein